MSRRTLEMTEQLYDYLLKTSLRDTPLQKKLRQVTAKMKWGGMQISPEQGQFMALLVELIGARKAIEIGTFTGYSGLSVAAALPANGHLWCCDVSEEFTATARKFWKLAKLDKKITLTLAPATETIAKLLKARHGGTFDFAFIDADKANYDAYYEGVLKLLRKGGLIAIDNVLWGGRVADPARKDPDTTAIRKLNAKILKDKRVTASLLPIGDGLTLARKR
ncbi:MAG: SAM-dependent methyltransferase [Alphaproteobacteria bacterium]|nr:SAM-dependent methyltransferase [Alphaproteobacteria bacterium]